MQTPYGYKEQHLMIDGVFLPYYVDSYAKASEGGYFKGSVSLLGLYPAWGKDLLHRGEIRFIWNLIDREEPVVLPLLVCEDDLDLSCIVIVAFFAKTLILYIGTESDLSLVKNGSCSRKYAAAFCI